MGEERLRVTVRVTPGASRERVGGSWGPSGEPPALRVAVTARAVDGAATKAVCAAVAKAFGIRASQVRLVSGATSRTKVLELSPAPPDGAARLAELLAD